jgi:hypothetical protein
MVERAAVLSRCGRYRYALRRTWDATKPRVLFIGVNPSTADAKRDDPTLRRCIRFATDWGFGALAIGNLFAFRSPNPKRLTRMHNPIGPHNDAWLRRLGEESTLVVAAWGSGGRLLDREQTVRAMFDSLQCLGTTAGGFLRHPLYV